MLKAGQFKAPFGRQELTSSGNQQFVDRSIASVLFAPARQIGLQIGGQFGFGTAVPDMITYAGGIFNGNGINRTLGENDKYEYTGRVMFSPFGNVGYSEAQPGALRLPRFGRGGLQQQQPDLLPAWRRRTDRASTSPRNGAPTSPSRLWADSSSTASTTGARSTTPRASRHRQTGATAQVGWLFGDHFEIAGRYSFTDVNTARDDRNIEEWRGGLSWYFNKHFWKLQADYGVTENEALNGADGLPPRKNKEFRMQAQLMF